MTQFAVRFAEPGGFVQQTPMFLPAPTPEEAAAVAYARGHAAGRMPSAATVDEVLVTGTQGAEVTWTKSHQLVRTGNAADPAGWS